MNDINMKIREELFSLAEPKFQKFSSSLIPNCVKMIGVRLPILKKMSKEIAIKNPRQYLINANDDYFEEIMLQGFVIGRLQGEFNEVLPFIKAHIAKITNWSLCDSFCSALKIIKTNKDEAFSFIYECALSKEEYKIRFGIVSMLIYFIDCEHIEKLFFSFENADRESYYVKMAVAWALSACFIEFPTETMQFLSDNRVDTDTYNMALSKIVDSKRVSDDVKVKIKNMKLKQK